MVACCLLVILLLAAGAANGVIVKDEDESGPGDPRFVFGDIARAWEAMDVQALADLVHPEGLRVSTGDAGARKTQYSPSQAYYYFKNLFQSHRTLVFEFTKMQDATAGDRVHGMAVWKRRRPDSEKIQELKLVCVLARQDDGWMLAEINKIR